MQDRLLQYIYFTTSKNFYERKRKCFIYLTTSRNVDDKEIKCVLFLNIYFINIAKG